MTQLIDLPLMKSVASDVGNLFSEDFDADAERLGFVANDLQDFTTAIAPSYSLLLMQAAREGQFTLALAACIGASITMGIEFEKARAAAEVEG